MKENELMFKPLGACLVRKNFIKNYPSNYEEYLTEYINCSKFVTDYGNHKFELVRKQSNKEPDIKNKKYQLDYKLLIDSKTMENIVNYSENITIDKNGARIYSASNCEGKWRRYLLTNIIKEMSTSELKQLEELKIKNKFEKIVADYLNKIRVNKNALYFLPFDFSYKTKNKNDYKLIAQKFSEDLKSFIEYRKEYTKCDTYLCFFMYEKIVFLKYINKFVIYDIVDNNKSNNYMKLKELDSYWGSLLW